MSSSESLVSQQFPDMHPARQGLLVRMLESLPEHEESGFEELDFETISQRAGVEVERIMNLARHALANTNDSEVITLTNKQKRV
jgi:hypothetical protein